MSIYIIHHPVRFFNPELKKFVNAEFCVAHGAYAAVKLCDAFGNGKPRTDTAGGPLVLTAALGRFILKIPLCGREFGVEPGEL